MANLTGFPSGFHGPTSVVDSTQSPPFGTRGLDTNGYEYVYVDFQQAFIAGEWVVYDESYAATNLSATAVGPVGIVCGTVSASDRFGWIMVKGTFSGAVGTSDVADNKILRSGVTTAAGWVTVYSDAASDAGNIVYGAYARSAGTSATSFAVGDGTTLGSTFTVQITYPYVVGFSHVMSTGASS